MIFSQLPEDIVNQHIIPYTYKLQNKRLLNDIRNYHETSILRNKLYFIRWIEEWEEEDEEQDIFWIYNDIIFFLYIQNPNINYTDKFLSRSIISKINLLWASLLPFQRKQFIILFYP
jgi:hypothetical protein